MKSFLSLVFLLESGLIMVALGGVTLSREPPIISALGHEIDPKFAINPKELQLNEMSQNIVEISGAVMGIAELVVEIKSELKEVRKEIGDTNKFNSGRNELDKVDVVTSEEREAKYKQLADRLEKILAIENNAQVNLVKDEMRKTMEVNFIRVLSTMLVSGPMKTQERRDEIFKLMKSVLNGELDFAPVVDKLPFILRDNETNQFITMIKTLRDEDAIKKSRQGPQDEDEDDDEEPEATTVDIIQQQLAQAQAILLAKPTQTQVTATTSTVTQTQSASLPGSASQTTGTMTMVAAAPSAAGGTATTPPMMMQGSGIDKVIDAVGGLNVNQVAQFLNSLPGLFSGIEMIVDGAEDYLSFGV